MPLLPRGYQGCKTLCHCIMRILPLYHACVHLCRIYQAHIMHLSPHSPSPHACHFLIDSRALDRGCTLVSPLSTVTGKGNIGLMEGIEAVYNMTLAQANKVRHDE